MPATPRQITFTEDDFKERVDYSELEGDYEATLVDVTDIDAATGNYGWGFEFQVKGLKLTTRVWLKGGGGWKVREVFNALGAPVQPGQEISTLNPNSLIGRTCVVTVKQSPRHDDPERTYAEVTRHTPFVSAEVPDFSDL